MHRTIITAAAFSFLSSNAMAEVCDKIRPEWSPEDGAVGYIGDFLFEAASPMGLLFGVIAALALVTGYRWLYVVTGILAAFWSATILLSWGGIAGFDDVYAGSIREGCRAAPYLILASLGAVAFWSLFKATRPKEELEC